MNKIADKRNKLLFNLLERLFFQQTRASKLLLIDFLNAILADSLGAPIQTISHQSQSTYLLNANQLRRKIVAETKEGAELEIGIQVHQSDYFHEQIQPFMVHFKQAQTKVNEKIRRFIIHILNFNLLQESIAYHNCYHSSHLQNSNHRDTQEIHYLELPKFTSHTPNTLLEKWLYFIDQVERKESGQLYQELVKKEPTFKLAEHLYQRDHISQNGAIIVKEKQLDLSEWKDLGHQIEKERIALNMIKEGMPYQQIMKLTDLTLAELDALALTIPLT